MPFELPPLPPGVPTVDDVYRARRRAALAGYGTCRRCRAPVEKYDAENRSSQCAFHNDEDDAMRREYAEDEARYQAGSDDDGE